MKNIKYGFNRAYSFIQEGIGDSVQKHEDEFGSKKMVAALYDAKLKDEMIIQLVIKYYPITKSDAQELLRIEKNIMHPCRELENYLMNEKVMSHKQAVEYIINNNVVEILENNNTLWKLSAKGLFEKINNKS